MAVLEEIGQALSGAADRVGPAVVGLGRGWGRGSGVVSAPGVVLTNAHNLRGDEVTVTFADGRRETGSVAGVDVEGDLARVETPVRPKLGVAIAPPHVARRLRRAVGLEEREGLLVRWVQDGSPADRAGIEKGDLIAAVNGDPITRLDDLYKHLDSGG